MVINGIRTTLLLIREKEACSVCLDNGILTPYSIINDTTATIYTFDGEPREVTAAIIE